MKHLRLILALTAAISALAEIPVSPARLIEAPGSKDHPSVASNDESHFVAWCDDRGGNTIFGTRITRDGEVLDPSGIDLGTGDTVNVVWSGRYWLVVTGSYQTQQVNVYTIDRDGRRLAARHFFPLFPLQSKIFVASNSSTTVILCTPPSSFGTWKLLVDVYGAPISLERIGPSFQAAIASNGDGFLVGWSTGDLTLGSVNGVTLNAAGTTADAVLLYDSVVDEPRLVSNGRDYLFAGKRRRDSMPVVRRIQAIGRGATAYEQPGLPMLMTWAGDRYLTISPATLGTLSSDGVPLQLGGAFPLMRNLFPFEMAASAIGSNVLIAWTQGISASASQRDLAFAIVDSKTFTISREPSIASLSAAPQWATSAATGGGVVAIAWQELANGFRALDSSGSMDSYVAVMTPDGHLSPPIRLNDADHSEFTPHIVWNGKAFDVVTYRVDGRLTHIVSRSMSATGILDPLAQVIAETCRYSLDLATNHDMTLVVWADCNSNSILVACSPKTTPSDMRV